MQSTRLPWFSSSKTLEQFIHVYHIHRQRFDGLGGVSNPAASWKWWLFCKKTEARNGNRRTMGSGRFIMLVELLGANTKSLSILTGYYTRIQLPMLQNTPNLTLYPHPTKLFIQISCTSNTFNSRMTLPTNSSTTLRTRRSFHRHPTISNGKRMPIGAVIPTQNFGVSILLSYIMGM
jgi:hypothetical protein